MFTPTSEPRVSILSCSTTRAAHHHSIIDGVASSVCPHAHRNYGKAVECGKKRLAAIVESEAVSMATVADVVAGLYDPDYEGGVEPEEDVRATLESMGLHLEAAALSLSRATAEAVLGRIVFERAGLA